MGVYTKNDDDNKSKLPPGEPIEMTSEGFENWRTQKNEKKKFDVDQTETIFNKNTKDVNQDITEEDFEIIKVLGRGAFGKVNLCIKKDTNDLYAVKIMSKADIIERNQVDQIKSEKDILVEMNHQFLVSLEFCFHSPTRIYFGMRFLQGGELFQHLKAKKRFTEQASKFYAAQILLA